MAEESSISPIQAAAQTRWLDAYRALDTTLPRPSPLSDDVTHARELLDAEVAGIYLLLSVVKERSNELTLPSLLPTEILAHIFSLLSELDPFKLSFPRYGSRNTLGWLTVSHVCRRWRRVCINQPSLWTHLHTDLHHSHWDMLLERAKEAPLFIHGSLSNARGENTHVKPILQHGYHIQTLSLSDIRVSQFPRLINGFVGPLHQLRVLSLSCVPDHSAGLPSIPPTFLTKLAPNVQELTLVGILFPWGEGSPKITKLHYQHSAIRSSITTPSFHKPVSHTLSDVMRTLRQLPALKHLKLVDALPDQSLGPDVDPISLPSLEQFELLSDYDSCWQLWSQIRIPSAVDIQIHGKRSLTTLTESLIVNAFRSHLKTSPHPAYQVMSIDIPSATMVRFTLSDPKEVEMQFNLSTSYVRPSSSIALHMFCDDGANLARQIVAQVQLEHVWNLVCSGRGLGDIQAFYDIFLPARGITTLTLTQTGAGHGLAALIPTHLSASPESAYPHSGDRVLFPSLSTLTCSGVNFEQQLRCLGIEMNVRDVLGRALNERSDGLNLKLKVLDIESCDVLEDWVEEWRELVDQVE